MNTIQKITCCSLLLPATLLAEPDPRPSILEYLHPDKILQSTVQSLIVGLRSEIGITYNNISSDLAGTQLAITDIKLYPHFPWLTEMCEIGIQRASINGNGLSDLSKYKAHIDLSGVSISPTCLPQQASMMTKALQIDPYINRAYADVTYHFGSSALQAKTHISMDKLAMLNLDLDFSYVALPLGIGYRDRNLGGEIRSGTLVIENQGLWKKLKPILPKKYAYPKTASKALNDLLTQAIQDSHYQADNSAVQLSQPQKKFIQSAKTSVAKFMKRPRQLVLELNPEYAWLDDERLSNLPKLIDLVKPVVSNISNQQQQTFDGATLKKAFTSPNSLSTEQRLAIGKALINGVGAPKSLPKAIKLLSPLSAESPEAGYLLATGLQKDSPEKAYRYSLIASKHQVNGALSLMNQLENQLSTQTVLSIQDSLLKNQPMKSLANMRNKAFAYLMGVGESRNYARAWLLANLAAAAGDSAALSIREEIDRRMQNRGKVVAELWKKRTNNLSEQAISYWVDNDLSKALKP